jgi:hypothetical protein
LTYTLRTGAVVRARIQRRRGTAWRTLRTVTLSGAKGRHTVGVPAHPRHGARLVLEVRPHGNKTAAATTTRKIIALA